MTDTSLSEENSLFEATVVVSRLGEVKLPVDLLVHFENGDEVLEHWDGEARVQGFTYRRPQGILWATVDPDHKLVVDLNVLNNSKTLIPPAAPAWKYTAKVLFWIQNLLQAVAILG